MMLKRRMRIGMACLVTAAGAAALVVGPALGAESHPAATKAAATPTIAFVCATPVLAPFYAPMETGAKTAAAELGVHLSYTGLTSTVTAAAMTQVLTAALNQHPAALIFCNYFSSADDSIIKKATARGLPVFFTNTTTDAVQDGVTTSFGQPDLLAGQQAGTEMYADGVRNPLCVDDSPINAADVARCTGFTEAFKAKGVKVTTVNLPESQYGNSTEYLTDVEGALAANHKIDGILDLSQVSAPLVAEAVAHAGMTGKVTVGTFDIDAQDIGLIKKGTVSFAIWQQPYLQGYLPVAAAALLLAHGFKYGSPEIYTGPTFVTKANASVVQASAAAGLA